MTIIMLLSAAVPAFASGTDVYVAENNESNATDAPPYEVVVVDGVLTLRLNAEVLSEILKDKSITKEELLSFVPEDVLNALGDGMSAEALAEIVSSYINAENIKDLIGLLPTDVILDYFDLSLLESILTVDELLALIPIDDILSDVTEEQLESIVNSEVLALLLTDEVKDKVLTDEFIEELLGDGEVISDILADGKIHDELAALVDGAIVDKILANAEARERIIALAESSDTLTKILADHEAVTAIKDYMFQHTERVDEFLSDPAVIVPLRNSSIIRGFISDHIDPHTAIDEDRVDFDQFMTDFGITEDNLKDNADRLGVTVDEIQQYQSFEELYRHDAFDAEALCEIYGITVEKLIHYGHVTDSEVAYLISDNWDDALQDEELVKHIISLVGLHALFENFGRDGMVGAIGGYYGMIERGFFSEKDVVEAIGGYDVLIDYLLPEKLDEIISIVGYEKWLEFVDLRDVIDAAGGYSQLLSMYSIQQLNKIVNTRGIRNIIDFARECGLHKKVDIKAVMQDVLSTVSTVKGRFKPFAKNVANRMMQMLNLEFSTIQLNDTVIYKNGSFYIQETVTALLQTVPDIDTFLSMESGDRLIEFVIKAPIRGEEWSLGVAIELTGDISKLQDRLEPYKDHLVFDVSDELDISTAIVVPSVISDVYEKALASDRIPESLKIKLLELPTMTVADAAELIENISDEEIAKLAELVSEKAEAIRDKAYAKIDAVAGGNAKIEAAKAKADQLIDALSDPTKLSALRDKAVAAVQKAGNAIGDRSILSFYDGEGTFSFDKSFTVDLYEYISKIVTLPDELLLLFNNDMTISGTLNSSVTVNGLYKVTVTEEDGTVKEFLMPEGIDLVILNDYAGVELDLDGEILPPRDSRYYPESTFVILFYNESGSIIKEITYTEESPFDPALAPAVPEKSGYTGEWESYTVGSAPLIEVRPIYKLVEYNATYVDGDTTGDLGKFTVNTNEFEMPTPISPEGYTFESWFVDINGNGSLDSNDIVLTSKGGNIYALPDGASLPTRDISIIAKYKTNSYTISFMDRGLLYHGYGFTVDNAIVTLPATEPFPTTDGDGEGDLKLADGDTLPLSENTAYAKYNAIEYESYYSVDGMLTALSEKTTVETVEVSIPEVSKHGYSFKYWFVDLDLDGEQDENEPVLTLANNGRFSLPTGTKLPASSVVFVAVFEINNYKLIFDDRGTTVAEVILNVNDMTARLPADPTPADGYKFTGWYIDTDGDGSYETKLTEGYVFTELEDVTAVARYERLPVPTYTATFEVDGSVVTTVTFEEGATRLPSVPTVPAKEGYTGEWYVKIDETNSVPLSSYTLENKDITVYAKYVADPVEETYKAEFKVDGTVIETVTFNKGDTSLPTVPAIPAKEGYVGKWYVNVYGADDILLANYTLQDKDIEVYAKYEAIPVVTYTARFTASGMHIATVVFNEGATSLHASEIPAVPTLAGYKGTWYVVLDGGNEVPLSEYTLENKNIEVYAKYEAEPVEETYKAEFKVDGVVIHTVTFKKGTATLPASDIPAIPPKTGHTGAWYVWIDGVNDVPLAGYTLPNKDIEIYAKYKADPIIPPVNTFKAKFVADNVIVDTVTFEEGDTYLSYVPAVPYKVGYKGVWESYTLNDQDIIINAVYTPITYKATFVADGKTVAVIEFTVEDDRLSEVPAVPAKLGYTGTWKKYTLGASDITVEAVYSLNVYTATLMVDGNVFAEISFSIGDYKLELPPVPPKEGYKGVWENYQLGNEDIVINAIYTPIEDDEIITSDETDDGEKESNIAWWILLIIAIILIIIWIFSKRNDDDDKPEPPAEEPKAPAAAPVAPPPVPEEIVTVDEVDAETADQLMSDETAMAAVETVGGAGVGMKAIINICDINAAFSNGDTVDIDALKAKNLIPKKAGRIKILANGSIDKSITVYAEQFSVQAIKMITLTGGKAIQKK